MTTPEDRTAGEAATGAWNYGSATDVGEVSLDARGGLFSGGAWVEAASGRYAPVMDPATGKTICELAEAGVEDVKDAVSAAKEAQRQWTRLKPVMRMRTLLSIAGALESQGEDLAATAAIDEGTPIRLAREEVSLAGRIWRYYAGWCDKLSAAAPWREAEPIGICGHVIGPRKALIGASLELAPALAAGNTCVLKPHPAASLAVLRLGKMLEEAELPAGVVNLVTGGEETTEAIARHRLVRQVTLDVSDGFPEEVAAACVASGTRVRARRRGVVPHLIFDDASIDQAIEGVVAAALMGEGEPRPAGAAVFVQEPVLEEVTAKLKERLGTVRVGDPRDVNTDVGPINGEDRLAAVRAFLDQARENGAQVFEAAGTDEPETGWWQRPCLVTRPHPAQRSAVEAMDGPVVTVVSFRTPGEALATVGAMAARDAAAVWTDKGSKMFEIVRQLNAQTVWCNTGGRFDPAAPPAGIAALRNSLDS